MQTTIEIAPVNIVAETEKYSKISDLIKLVASDVQSIERNQLRYILTGGPGAGKTSIIKFLAEKGYSVVPEAATEIIEHDLKKELKSLGWQTITILECIN